MTARWHAQELWWKNAVVYCLDVETYMDANGDGVGDFEGLTRRLDHLAHLGVTCVWLLPFHPSSGDDGYAVVDYYAVDPRFGTLGDFVTFRRAAGERGIRVVLDVVVNHTSDRHPWFVESRASRTSPKRDWYVWSDEPIEAAEAEVFPGEQRGNWEYDEGTGQYWFHRFHPFQPDLNLANEDVRHELLKVMGFWLQLGVDGFRIDAVPFVAETVGVHGPAREEHHGWLREIHEFVTHRRGDAVLIGEANVEPDRMRSYFGDGDEMQLLFNFSQNAALIAALAEESAAPVHRHLDALPTVPRTCGWLNFVRLHDELSLERLSPEEQDLVFRRFAPDERMRIYGRGIRRRIAPMLCDRRRIELAYSLAFATPGMPMLLYGDEIGMGDDLALEGRSSVRTPMQWEPGPSGGFSEAPPDRLVRPLVHEPGYDPSSVSVAAQRPDPHSLLSWMRRLIDVRRDHPAIGLGRSERFATGHDDVLGHCVRWDDRVVVCVHNLAGSERVVAHDRLPVDGDLAVVFADDAGATNTNITPDGDPLVLGAFGYRWMERRDRRRNAEAPRRARVSRAR